MFSDRDNLDKERRQKSDNDVLGRRGRSTLDDSLSSNESGINGTGNSERIGRYTYAKKEIDELVRKLKEKYSSDDSDALHSEQDYLDAVNRGDMETAQEDGYVHFPDQIILFSLKDHKRVSFS